MIVKLARRYWLNLISIAAVPIILWVSLWVLSGPIGRKQCLDSPLPRRYISNTCEEHINGKWLDVNYYNSYQYNEAGVAVLMGERNE